MFYWKFLVGEEYPAAPDPSSEGLRLTNSSQDPLGSGPA